jgi:MoxR-like ATPase
MSSETKRTSAARRTKKTKASTEAAVDLEMAFIDEHNLISRCRNYLRQQKPLALEGGPGTGKTTLVQMLAQGFPMYTIVGTEMVTADIVGRYVLENASMIWADGLLLKAMREGAWLYLDEILHMPDDCLWI